MFLLENPSRATVAAFRFGLTLTRLRIQNKKKKEEGKELKGLNQRESLSF